MYSHFKKLLLCFLLLTFCNIFVAQTVTNPFIKKLNGRLFFRDYRYVLEEINKEIPLVHDNSLLSTLYLYKGKADLGLKSNKEAIKDFNAL